MKIFKQIAFFVIIGGCLTSCKSRINYAPNYDKPKLMVVVQANSFYILKATIDSSEYLIVSGSQGIAIIKHK